MLFYSTGQAAKELSVTMARVRALCQCGAIAAETTPGGQLRIPVAEVDRLKRDGLPAVPRPLPNSPEGAAASSTRGRCRGSLLAAPSDQVISAAEQVLITENLVKQRKLERELAEAENWFSERENAQSEERAAKERIEQEQRDHKRAERERTAWVRRWEAYALRHLRRLGYDAAQVRLDVQQAVRTLLLSLAPIPTLDVTKRLVNAVVEKAVQPWRRRKETRQAIDDAMRSLPSDILYCSDWAKYKRRAEQAATAAIGKTPTADRGTKKPPHSKLSDRSLPSISTRTRLSMW